MRNPASNADHHRVASTGGLSSEARAARGWLGLAVGVLILAGFLAVALVIGRMPPFDTWITDPLFFRRALVVHVDLALVVWFTTFEAALLFLLPGRGRSGWWTRGAVGAAAIGVLALVGSAAMPGAEPVLSNYIPAVDHPLFGIGLSLFAVAVLASFADDRFGEPEDGGVIRLSPAARIGLRATAWSLGLAGLTFVASRLTTPTDQSVMAYYETLFWGPGHVLQLANVCAMLAVWLILLGSALGREPLGERAARWCFGLLVLPWLASPLLALVGTTSIWGRIGFTRLMQLGLFPVVLVVLGACLLAVGRSWRAGELGRERLYDLRLTGFAVSAGLTVIGFLLGAAIRGQNTVVPGHYHANIGAVTACFMSATFLLLPRLGVPLPTGRLGRLVALQPALFGTGQLVFALGFGFAGAHGMARKVYGAEQAGRSLLETIGLGVMGFGGLVAVAGGVLFLTLVAAAWRRRSDQPEPDGAVVPADWSPTWESKLPSIPSNG